MPSFLKKRPGKSKSNESTSNSDLEDIKQRANSGSAKAQNRVGLYYQKNNNLSEAVKWYQQAVAQNHADAQRNLAYFYYKGIYFTKNLMKAADLFKRSALQGNATAQLYLGLLYEKGQGLEKSNAFAMEWYEKAAEQDNQLAKTCLNRMRASADTNQQQPSTNNTATESSPSQESVTDNDEPLTTTSVRALTSIEKEEGSNTSRSDSSASIGSETSNDSSTGVQKNDQSKPSVAKSIRSMSSRYSRKYSQIKQTRKQKADQKAKLMVALRDGKDLLSKKNPSTDELQQTFESLVAAAKLDNSQAQYLVGYMHHHGLGVEKNLSLALSWYTLSSEDNNLEALFSLGLFHQKGLDGVVKVDSEKAFQYFLRAAKLKHARSQFVVGACFVSGLGVEKNTAQAAKWYQKAAKQDVDLAQYRLGLLLEKGQGIKQDNQKALEWYKKASDLGLNDAKEAHASLEKKLVETELAKRADDQRQSVASTSSASVVSGASSDSSVTSKLGDSALTPSSNTEILALLSENQAAFAMGLKNNQQALVKSSQLKTIQSARPLDNYYRILQVFLNIEFNGILSLRDGFNFQSATKVAHTGVRAKAGKVIKITAAALNVLPLAQISMLPFVIEKGGDFFLERVSRNRMNAFIDLFAGNTSRANAIFEQVARNLTLAQKTDLNAMVKQSGDDETRIEKLKSALTRASGWISGDLYKEGVLKKAKQDADAIIKTVLEAPLNDSNAEAVAIAMVKIICPDFTKNSLVESSSPVQIDVRQSTQVVAASVVFHKSAASADSTESMSDLQKQIEALTREVSRLKQQKGAKRPSDDVEHSAAGGNMALAMASSSSRDSEYGAAATSPAQVNTLSMHVEALSQAVTHLYGELGLNQPSTESSDDSAKEELLNPSSYGIL